MKRFLLLLSSSIFLFLLSNCTPHQFSGGAAHKCYGWFGERIPGCVDNRPGYNPDGSYGSSSSSFSSSSYSQPYSYNESKQVLYYDRKSGGMKECAYNPGASGKCTSFKPFDINAYNSETLFYNSNTKAMQPCNGSVTLQGKCTAYGVYRQGLASVNQLFYNPSKGTMTTCSLVDQVGRCSSFDPVPRVGSTGGQYNTDSPSNPYSKKVIDTNEGLMQTGMDMLSGNCTLGLNC